MNRTILITGATGFIGKHITSSLIAQGDSVIALTTNVKSAEKSLVGVKKIVDINNILSLKDEKISGIINLAGRNLADKRWNDNFKNEVYDSRIMTTRKVVELISKMSVKPEVLLSASGVDYYGDTGGSDIYENSPSENNFIGKLCKDWEAEAFKAEAYGTRVVTMRTGFVIGKDSKAVKKFTMPFRFFIGGPIGSGKQYIPWIHINDVVGIYLFALDNGEVKGAINVSAPNPETMKQFCKNMATEMHRPSIFPVPGFIVKIAAGEIAQVVLSGRKALPKKIMELGYKFKYENSSDAWKDVFS